MLCEEEPRMRKLRSKWRRFVKGVTWSGDVSRDGLASALKRWRQERDRIYLVTSRYRPPRPRSLPQRIELGW
jgi:hypothetical protein